MRVVDAVNTLLSSPDDVETKLDDVLVQAKESLVFVKLQLAARPSIAADKQRASEVDELLSTLVNQTRVVQESGRSTLESVKSVTKEITLLDKTKENLTSSVRMLRQLRMLSKLYSQLDSLLKERRYADMAGAVIAASDLIEYFRPFRPLPRISQLSQEIGDMEIKIYDQVKSDFIEKLDSNTSHEKVDSRGSSNAELRAACEVLDSLDQANGRGNSRQQLIIWYCTYRLAEYKRIFSPEDEAGALENVTHRFTYLKNRVIKQYTDVDSKLFPVNWPVQDSLFRESCNLTADALVAQIPRLSSANGGDMELLLRVLQESRDFEKYIALQPNPALISSKISPFMSMWAEFQDKQIGIRIGNYMNQSPKPEPGDVVLVSSKELVNFYRVLLAQFANFDAPANLELKIVDILASNLTKYAQRVLPRVLPQVIRTDEDILTVGVVNSTVDYIISTTHQLERNITLKSNQPNQPNSQNGQNGQNTPQTPQTPSGPAPAPETPSEEYDSPFERALSKFRQVSLRCEDLLVNYSHITLEPHFVELGSQYSANKNVNGEVSNVSPFMPRLVESVNSVVHKLITALKTSSASFSVAQRVAEVVCVLFLTTVMARVAKPLPDSLVEQMLLDFGAIKQDCLLIIVDTVPKEGPTANLRVDRLRKRVLDLIGQTEAVLKVLLSSPEPSEMFVRNYQLLIKDRSTLNFRKMLDVKGVRFQSRAMDKFKQLASQDPSLAKQSYLLSQIPTVPPQQSVTDYVGSNQGAFGINNFKKIGEFLRRDY